MQSPSSFLVFGFAFLSLTVVGLACRAFQRWHAPALAIVWLSLTGGLAFSGSLLNFDSFPPPLMRLLLPTLVVTGLWSLSGLASPALGRWSLAGMVAFQAFRLPLELLMHRAAREGVMPPQMSYSGRNFDILTGILALVLGFTLHAKPQLSLRWVWAWNIVGLLLLINVVTVAVMSLPGPSRVFWQEPANLWVATFPFVWLPSVLVPLALAGHLLIARKLLAARDRT